MADGDRMSNGKWTKNMQENESNNGYYRGGRHGSRGGGHAHSGQASMGKPPVRIYRPGSGPLRKSGPGDTDNNNLSTPENSSDSSGRGSWRKPSQQLYQPPSRESTPGPSDPIKNVTEKVAQLCTSDSQHAADNRRCKKPEQAIYVPKARAQALQEHSGGDSDSGSKGSSGRHGRGHRGSHKNVEDTSEHSKTGDKWDAARMSKSETWDVPKSKSESWDVPKSKPSEVWERGPSHAKSRSDFENWRKPNAENRGGGKGRDGGGRSGKRFGRGGGGEDGTGWRASSPSHSFHEDMSPADRELRQASEPRSLMAESLVRDQRESGSCEPPALPAMPPKPPSGRRGRDTKQPPRNNLPPRFQKQAQLAAQASSQLEGWDGSRSLMFQGHSHTLPAGGGRASGHRGSRHHGGHHENTDHRASRNTRSLTPDQFKRPGTPPSYQGGRAPSPAAGRRTPSLERQWRQQESARHRGEQNPRFRHQSGGSWEGGDPFYRNRRLSDSRPPPSPPRRPSVDEPAPPSLVVRDRPSQPGRDHRAPNREQPLHRAVDHPTSRGDHHSREATESRPSDRASPREEVPLPPLPIPEIKDWSAEVEENERQEAEAAASSGEGPRGGDQHRKKKRKGRKRGSEGRGGRDSNVSLEEHASQRSPGSMELSPESAAARGNPPGPPSPRPHKGGLLVLPPPSPESSPSPGPHMGPPTPHNVQRLLFDPNNPSKPILVMAGSGRAPMYQEGGPPSGPPAGPYGGPPFAHPQFVHNFPPPDIAAAAAVINEGGRPHWYDHYSDSFRSSRNPHLLIDMERADWALARMIATVGLLPAWPQIAAVRQFLMASLQTLLLSELKFCEAENVEQHVWRLVFHNVIELLRKHLSDESIAPELRQRYKLTLLAVLDEGSAYFERLLEALQREYKFSVEGLTGPCGSPVHHEKEGAGPFTALAIISAQKVCLFLGDLARYREQASESAGTYNKARQWYTKAQTLNPKNGRPYNQLALLALYARRKLDAVYFYMRSLMASNPFHTARESLLGLFDENRKKYEALDRRRREERQTAERERQREKEAAGLRHEVWVHPRGQREWRRPQSPQQYADDELDKMPLPEVNRQFVTSYLHVQGKLFTKIGMERFQECAVQMLREFRALLQHSPVPVSCARFLQLLALNMFAIENTQLRAEADLEPGYRSVMQESALVMSLQMFSLILERCTALFPQQAPSSPLELSEDLQTLLPAVKVWCDWLLCHKAVWNPPPSCADFSVGPPGDAWSRLATLVNQLEKLDLSAIEFATEQLNGYELVRLPEDSSLAGFTPLMYNIQELVYAKEDSDWDLAQNCLRVKKIQFFGTVFLCGVDPPVLKLQREADGKSRYRSLVLHTARSSPPDTPATAQPPQIIQSEECESSEQPARGEEPESPRVAAEAPSEIRKLLSRKLALTLEHETQERHRQHAQAILAQQASAGGVEVEVRPRQLVADTNCFVDHLPALRSLTVHYSLMVPLVVLHELEGLSRGGRAPGSQVSAAHSQHVAESSARALEFLRTKPQGVRCITSLGTVLTSFTCTTEEEADQDVKNDDRILSTCLSLIKNSLRSGPEEGQQPEKPGERRHLFREVVLLTEDRNLRVKALARDVPVRDLPDFLQWHNSR